MDISGIETSRIDTCGIHILDTSFLQPCDETSFGKEDLVDTEVKLA